MSEESLLSEYTLLNKELEKNDRFIRRLLTSLSIFIFVLLFFYVFNIIHSTNTEILNLPILNNYVLSQDTIQYFDFTLYSVFFVLLLFIFIVLYGLRKRDFIVSRILEVTDLLNETSLEINKK